MNIYVEPIENDFASLLQKRIQIVHKDKILKEGRLMLFAIKDFYLTLQLMPKDSKKLIHYELPYPFKYTNQKDRIILSYQQRHFSKDDAEIEHYILFYFINNPSKLYNSEVFINKFQN